MTTQTLRRQAGRPLLAGLMVIGVIASGMFVSSAVEGAESLYAPHTAVRIRQELQNWAEAHDVPAPERTRLLAEWDTNTSASQSASALLERALTIWSGMNPAVSPVLEACRELERADAASLAGLVSRVPDSDFLSANLRAYIGRSLAELRLYDEALAALNSVPPELAIDPASLLFYRAVAAQGILETPTALSSLNLLLDRTEQVPTRYATVAELMRLELDDLQPQSLPEVARLMSDSERRLDLGRAGEQVQGVQERIVATLDELIKKIEAQQGGGGGGGSGASNSNQSSSGADDSRVKGATAPGETDSKKFGKEGTWGDLPEKQQAEAKNLINREFPSHYRQAIETYFKKLAGRPAAPEK